MFLKLFLTFLEIGAVSFGGGYGMISLIREKVLLNGWLSEAEFLSFIAVSESTPGPLAVNMATFIGASQGGVLGALCATLGVVLPSFFIILLIAALIHDLLKYAGVEAFLSGVRPCVVALILSTALTMGLSTLLGISTAAEMPSPAWRGIGILAILAGVRLIWQKARGKAPSPIGMILLSAVLGALLSNKKETASELFLRCRSSIFALLKSDSQTRPFWARTRRRTCITPELVLGGARKGTSSRRAGEPFSMRKPYFAAFSISASLKVSPKAIMPSGGTPRRSPSRSRAAPLWTPGFMMSTQSAPATATEKRPPQTGPYSSS